MRFDLSSVLLLLIFMLFGCRSELDENDCPEPISGSVDVALNESADDFDRSVIELDAESLRVVIREAWETADVRDFKDLEEFLVIDVRGFEQYSKRRIRGAVNVELKDLLHEAGRWKKERKLIIYSNGKECLVARKAARRLLSSGFKKVFVYGGGIEDWALRGFETDGRFKI
ncbi:rhodanese-like domain-containing protein [Candidatus Dependentiae bacterium]